MKTFKFLAALLLAVVYVGLASCSKDDGGKNDNGLLVGTWVEDEGDREITFKTDGSGIIVRGEGVEKETYKFTYTLDGKTMMLRFKYDNPKPENPTEQTFKIELNGDALKLAGDTYHRKK